MEIRRDGPVAVWRQIAAVLVAEIESGKRAPGSRLPSVRDLTETYEIAGTTAQKVIEYLRDEGLAVTSPMGTFVAERSRQR